MQHLTRRKIITTATTIAVITVAAVMVMKLIGAVAVAAFLAGVGVTLVIGLVILVDILTKSAERKK